jgi:hypothetical protein
MALDPVLWKCHLNVKLVVLVVQQNQSQSVKSRQALAELMD